ncbi:MAG: HypC/HybG/HupF family hydrogenase formation chaperone [Phycisphaerae bacterium]|nr:HypC/HybG/HupF family hydrogenase formation chaperone [Phycisphaerae bacterium]
MCLAVPGKIVEIRSEGDGPGGNVGIVDFQGTRVEVGLAFTPDASPGDWVLVHAGYALNVLDEQEAAETWQYLKEAEVVDEVPRGSP